MKIPVANIYYLLAYAWDKLEESRLAPVEAEACDTPLELLAQVLIGGTARLFKKGLDQHYREQEDTLAAIKGKLLVGESLKRSTFQQGRAVCRFDVFDHDVLHNQILKTTLRRLSGLTELDVKTRRQARNLHQRFHQVQEIALTESVFNRVQLHRNNRFYGFLMHICAFLHANLLPDEKTGACRFRDFLRDDRQMSALFEAFVRNFYKKELPAPWKVSREDIRWQAGPVDAIASALLPKMQTDISLRTTTRKIIIDTKYYQEILINRFGSEKLRREHLSQVFSYLKHQVTPNDSITQQAEGILLYATAGQDLRADYPDVLGHRISIRTVNLNAEWKAIREQLFLVIGD